MLTRDKNIIGMYSRSPPPPSYVTPVGSSSRSGETTETIMGREKKKCARIRHKAVPQLSHTQKHTNLVADLAEEHGRRMHPEAHHDGQEQQRVGRQGARVRPRPPWPLRLLLVGHRLAVAVAFSAAVERQQDAQNARDEAHGPDVVIGDDGPPEAINWFRERQA